MTNYTRNTWLMTLEKHDQLHWKNMANYTRKTWQIALEIHDQ